MSLSKSCVAGACQSRVWWRLRVVDSPRSAPNRPPPQPPAKRAGPGAPGAARVLPVRLGPLVPMEIPPYRK